MRIRTQGRSPAEFAWKAALIALAIFAAFNLRLSSADNAPQTPPFAQDWTNAGLITTDDNWTGVPGISGYRGDDLASAGADPQTVLADDALAVLDVNANQTNPSSYTTGGVAEFAIANPVVALNGSGTADAPYLLITLNITAQQNVRVQYNVRDLDGSADSSVQPLALHYRVGSSGAFTNVPGAFIADATTGPSLATLVTPVDVVLPAAADNQPLMQLRIMTTNAAGNDEWIGIDDIVVSGTPIAGDQAPSVTSTTPAANASNVAITSNITVNFSEAVNLGAGAVTVQCPAGTPVATNVAAANLSQLVLDPVSDLPAGTTCSVLIESTLVADTDANDPPNELAADVTFSFSTVASAVTCTSPFTPIYSIQGGGASAAITGTVTTKGVVVGDHEGPAPALRGFYLQDLAGDGISETSDGIFVFNANTDSVVLGDVVYVTGTAGEFQDQTQISTVTGILDCGDGSVAATPVTFPVPDTSPPYLERFEGMLVQLTQTLYVTELFQLGRFGQVTVSVGDRLAQPTNVVAPGAPAIALQAANNRSRIILDDVLNNQNPDPIQFGRAMTPLSATNTLRGGDTVTGFTGVLNYTWGGNTASPNAYRVRPVDGAQTNVPNFLAANPRPASAPVVGGNLKVASFNVLNYFLTLDVGTQPTCGPVGSKQECRGAETAEELSRQQRKLTEALYALDADIVGLIEIENSQDAGGNEVDALAQIVADLNLRYGVATYAYVDTGIVGTDTIRVGYIYKPAKATPVAGGLFVDGAAVHNRPPVSQLFQAASGGKFNVVVNHFKSKSCSGVVAGSPDDDQGDGQGCFNAARIAQANALVAFINGTVVPTTGDADVLIIGDLNAYAMEQPVSIIKAAGYTNLIAQFGGADAYSYVFDGQWGYLDHALASASLLPQVAGAADYHINADEPSVLDYNLNFKSARQFASLFSPDEFRTSDHDPVVVGLSLTREPARICLNLGNDASQYLPDTDSFTFQGTAGDFVRIRVEQAAPIMQGRASLLVTGPFFLKLNLSAIPNEVSGNIVRSGRHTIFLSELFGRDSFRGNYCLLVSSTGASQTTLQGTSLAE